MRKEKEFKTHNQQLKILRRRQLYVPYNGTPKKILMKHNYYKLINGYKDLFIDTPATTTSEEIYKRGSRFSEIFALYNFDNEMKMILLKRILGIEKVLKSEIAYIFSEKYSHDNYFKVSNFDLLPTNNPKYNARLSDIIKLVTNLQNDISKNLKNNSINHYITVYGYIPLWVLINIITFGRLSYLYQFMKHSDREKVARIYGIRENELIKLLKILTLARNKCAHDERIYNFYSREAIKNNAIHTQLSIPSAGGNPKQGKQDLFAVIIAIKILIDKKSFNKMITEIKTTLKALDKELYVISILDILNEMGFPPNWKDIVKY